MEVVGEGVEDCGGARMTETPELEVVKVRTSDLIEYEYNAKEHPEEQVEQIKPEVKKIPEQVIAEEKIKSAEEKKAGTASDATSRNISDFTVPDPMRVIPTTTG